MRVKKIKKDTFTRSEVEQIEKGYQNLIKGLNKTIVIMRTKQGGK